MGDKLTTEELDYFLKGIKVQKILGKLPDGAGIPKYTRTTTDSIEVLDVGMKNLSSFSGDGFIDKCLEWLKDYEVKEDVYG